MPRERGTRGVFATFWANASHTSWAVKPTVRETGAEEQGVPLDNHTSHISEEQPPSELQSKNGIPSTKLTTRQFLYIAGSHGIGAMVISGGINFAVAYAMYTRTDDPIRLFELPNTLAGDTAVTVIVQTIVTWMIEMLIVNYDLRKGNIQPIGFIAEPSLTGVWSRAARWFMLLDLSKAQRKRSGSVARQLLYLFSLALRAFVVSVLCFSLLFGPCVGILIAVGVKDGGDWVYASRWAPEVFKLVLASVLSLMTSPFFAMYWMVKCGWDGGTHEAVVVNGNG